MRNSRHEISVYERENKLIELGVGISLWANSTRLFDEMGIASPMGRTVMRNGCGLFFQLKTAAGGICLLLPADGA
ncbi:hypothetical protein BG74_00965 [Sodalis-like endosymbiont of Proechinophthirus fluctus]|nr:hypothetical protein BG74_00965 [Sodalis-like endosymbiont of Proechinophthirus fluctus]